MKWTRVNNGQGRHIAPVLLRLHMSRFRARGWWGYVARPTDPRAALSRRRLSATRAAGDDRRALPTRVCSKPSISATPKAYPARIRCLVHRVDNESSVCPRPGLWPGFDIRLVRPPFAVNIRRSRKWCPKDRVDLLERQRDFGRPGRHRHQVQFERRVLAWHRDDFSAHSWADSGRRLTRCRNNLMGARSGEHFRLLQ